MSLNFSEPRLAPVPESLKSDYTSLIAEVDIVIAELSSRLHHFLHCGPGCASCCQSFSVLPIEAALIEERIAHKSPPAQPHHHCPLLLDQRCTVYTQRPLICRTQGLPIAYVDEIEERIDVSACPLNFSDEHPFELNDLFFIDQFNSRLSALNRAYCQHAGLAPDQRVPLGQ